jgi:mono/diheme cytochrome c family protein
MLAAASMDGLARTHTGGHPMTPRPHLHLRLSRPPAAAGLALLAGLLGTTAAQADPKVGQGLHDNNCVACHVNMTGGDGSLLYTRATRRVQSLAGLESQVRLCESNLGLQWFDEDILAVTGYLNDRYYKFPEE